MATVFLLLRRLALGLLLSLIIGGVGATPLQTLPIFRFGHDSLAYRNELLREFYFDNTGRWVGRSVVPRPAYALHCFTVALTARQFFYHARFDPRQARLTAADYRQRVQEVLSGQRERPAAADQRVVIPGYADLYAFSKDWEYVIKDAGGGAWRSYIQRGNWRMIFPFSRRHQAATAASLQTELARNRVPIVHLVQFPSLGVNHAVLLFAVTETPTGLRFAIYDPNDAGRATVLFYDRATSIFVMPRNNYFFGGPVDVYEVYRGLWY